MAPNVVLVVEDDADVRTLIELALTGAGYRVATAVDGRAALTAVAREMPALILLDMRMPGMNGWEFAGRFREQYDHVAPIVVVTAAKDGALRAADIAADDHLDKPFELDELLAVVARHLTPAASASQRRNVAPSSTGSSSK